VLVAQHNSIEKDKYKALVLENAVDAVASNSVIWQCYFIYSTKVDSMFLQIFCIYGYRSSYES